MPPSFYEQHSNAYGWGPDTAQLNPQRLQTLIGEMVPGTVLDVGCATGIYVKAFAQAGFQGTGIDFSEVFIRKHAALQGFGNYAVGSIVDLPFRANSFDNVIAADILEHVEDDHTALQEVARVASSKILVIVPQQIPSALLRTGLVYSDYQDRSHLRYYNRETLTELIEQSCPGMSYIINPMGEIPTADAIAALLQGGESASNRFVAKALTKAARMFIPNRRHHEWLAVIDKSSPSQVESTRP